MNQEAQVIQFDAGSVFGDKPSGKMVNGWDKPSAYTPRVDPMYVFPPTASELVVWLIYGNDPLYMFGPTGCGKTSGIKQVVTRLNYPVYEVTGHNRLEFPELVGHHTVVAGETGLGSHMEFVYGPLALAMKHGGIFLMNEIDLLDPSTAAGLNSVLDGSPLSIPENGGELIIPHPMFRFVATANSNGASDETGLYQGVLRQNLAFMDRFVLVEVGYLSELIEAELVKKHITEEGTQKLPDDIIDKMIRFANAVRSLFMGKGAEGFNNQIEVTLSTRTILRWAYLIVQFEPLSKRGVDVIDYALDRALGFRASKASQRTLKELRQRIFG